VRFWGQAKDEDPGAQPEGEEFEGVQDPDAASEEDDEEPLEPEVQARVQAEARKLADAEVGQYREAARKRGLDWTGSDFGVVDYGRAAQSFGFAGQQQQAPAAQQAAPEEEEAEPELDVYDPDSVKGYTSWQVRQQTKALRDENARLRNSVQAGALDQAMDRAADAISKHARHLEPMLDHPQFAQTFREALATQAPELWRDPKNLARVAALISVDLDPEELPKGDRGPDRSRDTQGRFAPGADQRRQLERLSPTRGQGGNPAPDDLTDGERRAIREGHFESAAQVRALRSGSFEDYERGFLTKRKGNGR
jgi:hypothetical protein